MPIWKSPVATVGTKARSPHFLEHEPTTDDDARSIVNDSFKREKERYAKSQSFEDETDEAEAILDGSPPELPPATVGEPQKLSAETPWAETEQFEDAVEHLRELPRGLLRELRAKPVARFVGKLSRTELQEVIDQQQEFIDLLRAIVAVTP